jgi:methionine synthase II (cobalamin-independent)
VSPRDIKLWTVHDIAAQGTTAARSLPWPDATATGIGSMPGTDPVRTCAVIMEELPDFPFLAELPDRGVGADMIGRTASLLLDLPVETTPRGWKFAAHQSRDQRRAASFLSYDLDAAREAADGYSGPFKISVCGPLTLAARIELSRSMNPALADPGALADLSNSLAEGIAAHVRDIRERIPGATIVVQIDEPALPAVLAGHVPTASGLGTVRALDQIVASATLRSLLAATTAFTVLHCCAADLPFLLVREMGAGAVSFDLALMGSADIDVIAELGDDGLGLLVGAYPTDPVRSARPRSPRDTAAAVVTMWQHTSLEPERLVKQVVITPACGLAGLSPEAARDALVACREAARIAPELMEDGLREDER